MKPRRDHPRIMAIEGTEETTEEDDIEIAAIIVEHFMSFGESKVTISTRPGEPTRVKLRRVEPDDAALASLEGKLRASNAAKRPR